MLVDRVHRALRVLSLACGLLAAVPLRAQPAEPARSDPRAVELAREVLEALGGREAWKATRYLRFDFEVERGGKSVVRRAHTWDKWTGRYRLEAKTREGQPYLVVMNLNTREGAAFLDGKRLAGDEEKKYLEQGYAVWINDTYWLLMPYKLEDPGVTLTLAGEEQTAAGAWDKLHLSFDNVGLTPKDQYWVFVNRATHLVDRWEFVLKGEQTPPTPFEWKGWRAYGRIQLAGERVSPQDGTRIFFPVLETPESVADDVFAPPAAGGQD